MMEAALLASENKSNSSKPTNPKDRAATSRLDLSLFPDTAVCYGSLAMTEGDLKYGGYNYRPSGVLASVYVAACRRHLAKWYNGEWCDEKTKVPHLASALACIAVIIDAYECGVLNDDRPPKCDVAKLLENFESLVSHLQSVFPNGPDRFREDAKNIAARAEATGKALDEHLRALQAEIEAEKIKAEMNHLHLIGPEASFERKS